VHRAGLAWWDVAEVPRDDTRSWIERAPVLWRDRGEVWIDRIDDVDARAGLNAGVAQGDRVTDRVAGLEAPAACGLVDDGLGRLLEGGAIEDLEGGRGEVAILARVLLDGELGDVLDDGAVGCAGVDGGRERDGFGGPGLHDEIGDRQATGAIAAGRRRRERDLGPRRSDGDVGQEGRNVVDDVDRAGLGPVVRQLDREVDRVAGQESSAVGVDRRLAGVHAGEVDARSNCEFGRVRLTGDVGIVGSER